MSESIEELREKIDELKQSNEDLKMDNYVIQEENKTLQELAKEKESLIEKTFFAGVDAGSKSNKCKTEELKAWLNYRIEARLWTLQT